MDTLNFPLEFCSLMEGKLASDSSETFGRKPSSVSCTTGLPSLSLPAPAQLSVVRVLVHRHRHVRRHTHARIHTPCNGTISFLNLPAAVALAARLCDSTANASICAHMLPQKENPTAKQTDKQTGGETSKAHKPKRLAHLCARDAVLLGNNLGAFELHHRSNPFGTAAVCRPADGHRAPRRTERLWVGNC